MVKFLDIKKVTDSFQPALREVIAGVVDSGSFVRGDQGKQFEDAYAAFTGVSHCVGVGNGFDALRLIFRAWILSGVIREGDEVIVPANTYIASILAVTENRLVPVMVEPDANTFNIDPHRIREKITSRTRAIMVVHLYGRNGMHPEIRAVADAYGLRVVEDCAQAAGCFAGNTRTGALGDAAAHSFFPTKNLGALGDGGAVTTDDAALAATVRALSNYGSHERGMNHLPGVNSRLDEVQAAVLRLKLLRLDADNAARRKAAQFYLKRITHPDILLPQPPPDAHEHVWHLFVIRCAQREQLKAHLHRKGVEALVHYPIAPHQQPAYTSMNGLSFPLTEQIHREVLSLPLSPVIADEELAQVVEAVGGFVSI